MLAKPKNLPHVDMNFIDKYVKEQQQKLPFSVSFCKLKSIVIFVASEKLI